MSSSVCNILDVPDDVLAKIFSYFNPRERLALGDSCKRFYSVVFGNEDLLRDLDFSENSRLTSEADIQKYFDNEHACKHILKMNAKNVNLENILSSTIGKAINIVDLNIHGTKIRYVEELHSFLDPLLHLKRLSVDWPILGDYDDAIGNKVLEKSLGRLTYLSVELYRYTREFLLTIQLCQQLEELRLMSVMPIRDKDTSLSQEPMKLRNLKRVQYYGGYKLGPLKNDYRYLLVDPDDWTDFTPICLHDQGYLERNVEVCEELLHLKDMLLPKRISYDVDCYDEEMPWFLVPEHLLREVINVNYQDVPESFCCLKGLYSYSETYLVKIDEAKKLLKDSGYQISYLNLSHPIEINCDAHLVASAFPNLTELVICRIINSTYALPEDHEPFPRRLRKRGSTAPEEQNDPMNPDSSFKMLIENTPHLRKLTISPQDPYERDNNPYYWDFDALSLIPTWKNLTAIELAHIPFTNGNFLIDIGRECTKLEEITLDDLGDQFNYLGELLQMLNHCENLRKFSISEDYTQNISKLAVALSNNSKLRHVRLMTVIEMHDTIEFVASVEQLLHRCPELIKFEIKTFSGNSSDNDELRHALQRIVDELNRPDFELIGP